MKISQYSYTGAILGIVIVVASFFLSGWLCNSKNREVFGYIIFAICGCLLFKFLEFWGIFFCVFFVVYLLTDTTGQYRDKK